MAIAILLTCVLVLVMESADAAGSMNAFAGMPFTSLDFLSQCDFMKILSLVGIFLDAPSAIDVLLTNSDVVGALCAKPFKPVKTALGEGNTQRSGQWRFLPS